MNQAQNITESTREAERLIQDLRKTIPLKWERITNGGYLGAESEGYTFDATLCDPNISTVTAGYIQGEQSQAQAIVSEGWEYLAPEWFKVPEFGPGLRSPQGKVYRDGNIDGDCNDAIEAGGLMLIEGRA